MASESARSRQTTPGVVRRLGAVHERLGRMMTNASPARLAQLQRRAQAAQAGAEGILNRRAAGEKAGTITADVPKEGKLKRFVRKAKEIIERKPKP